MPVSESVKAWRSSWSMLGLGRSAIPFKVSAISWSSLEEVTATRWPRFPLPNARAASVSRGSAAGPQPPGDAELRGDAQRGQQRDQGHEGLRAVEAAGRRQVAADLEL